MLITSPADITTKGSIGLVSKSGTLTYQMMYELRDLGFTTAIGIGGDPIIGTTHIDALRELARIAVEKEKKAAERRALRAKYTVNPARARISVGYGRKGRIWDLGWHTGIDFNGNFGDSVYAARVGTVIFTGWRPAYGRTIEIRHLDGVVTRYAHLSRIRVEAGQEVDVGQRIGNIGASGKAFGAHLHFETLVNGNYKNPGIWLWGSD